MKFGIGILDKDLNKLELRENRLAKSHALLKEVNQFLGQSG
jgi:hypothetical protein